MSKSVVTRSVLSIDTNNECDLHVPSELSSSELGHTELLDTYDMSPEELSYTDENSEWNETLDEGQETLKSGKKRKKKLSKTS